MNYTENFEGIKMDIQAVDTTISEVLQQKIRDMIKRLKRHISEINWIDVYFKKETRKSIDIRMISIRLGIPGNDVFASSAGDYWLPVLKKTEEKLRRQLIKK